MWQFPMREQTNANDVISDDLGKSIETINEPVFKLKASIYPSYMGN